MPTIIGRFNELLHQLSSSSSATTSARASRPDSSGASSRIRGNNHHHHRPNTVQPLEYKSVRRSNSSAAASSATSTRTKAIVCKANRAKSPEESTTTTTATSSRRVRRQVSPGYGHHRHSSQPPSVSPAKAASRPPAPPPVAAKPPKRDSITRRESTGSILQHHHHSRRQQTPTVSTTPNRRRHSIASVASVTAPPPPIPKKEKPRVTSCVVMSSSSSSSSSRPKTAKKVESVKSNPVMNSDENDESLASKLARKMKINAIISKGPNNAGTTTNGVINQKKNNTGAILQSKKFLKAYGKKATSQARDEGCFIDLYLNGHLTKQHPDIISGKTCYDLPVKDVEQLKDRVVAAHTGPNGGLLNVHINVKPFDLADDVDFIDEDYPDSSLSSTGEDHSPRTLKSTKSSASTVSSDVGDPLASSNESVSPANSYNTHSASAHSEPIAGVEHWQLESDFAYGISTSLYESNPSTKRNAGDPIADSFGICVRENSAIIALADGVNWGEKACLASRCAIHGCIDYLNKALYSAAESTRVRNTLDIFVALLRSFNAAHNLILTQGGHLTTLCTAVICQLKNSDRFIVCTCNVGDSLAYVYSPVHGVREITQGSHDIFSMRDMRDALGALGPVSGSEPELNNLTVAMTVVDAGDIVFLTSDGISDNFDPVVGKFAMPKKESDSTAAAAAATNENKKPEEKGKAEKGAKQKSRKRVQRSNSNPERSTSRKMILHPENYTSKGLPLVSAQQRHELTLLRMEDLILNGVNNVHYRPPLPPKKMTAKELCKLMVDFSTKLTMAKRHILEDPELYSDNEDVQGSEAFDKERRRRRLVGAKLVQVPGKLDHASIAAVEIGFYGSMVKSNSSAEAYCAKVAHRSNSDTCTLTHSRADGSTDARYNLRMRATLARFESQDSLDFTESGPI